MAFDCRLGSHGAETSNVGIQSVRWTVPNFTVTTGSGSLASVAFAPGLRLISATLNTIAITVMTTKKVRLITGANFSLFSWPRIPHEDTFEPKRTLDSVLKRARGSIGLQQRVRARSLCSHRDQLSVQYFL